MKDRVWGDGGNGVKGTGGEKNECFVIWTLLVQHCLWHMGGSEEGGGEGEGGGVWGLSHKFITYK